MIKLEKNIEIVEDTIKLDSIDIQRQIPLICIKNVSGWDVEENDIVVIQLLDGLSNILFKVSLKSDINFKIERRTILFRIYGEHCSFYYDKAKELEIFQMLSNVNVGPKLLSQGNGWRIEEWIYNDGSVKVEELPNPGN
jgi:choline kinase